MFSHLLDGCQDLFVYNEQKNENYQIVSAYYCSIGGFQHIHVTNVIYRWLNEIQYDLFMIMIFTAARNSNDTHYFKLTISTEIASGNTLPSAGKHQQLQASVSVTNM